MSAINKRFERQTLLYAMIVFAYSDLPSGTFVPLIELPPGAVQVSGFVDVTTASNAGTSDVLDVGTSGTPNGYANDINFKAAARTALTIPAGRLSAKSTVGITRTAVGTAATAGAGMIALGYLQEGRHTEQYGSLDGNPLTIGS